MKVQVNKSVAVSALVLALGFAALQAHATIMLTPLTTGVLTTNDNSNFTTLSQINTAFGTSYSGLSLSYKAEVGSASSPATTEEGPFAANYTTVFSDTALDPMDALITYVGGSFINCPTCFLIVKDGNQSPAQYLFDLGSWNGTESISMTGFWPDQGAISNVAIWSGSSTSSTTGQTTSGQTTSGNQVSEPGILGLLGLGLLGQAFLLRQRRRRLQK